MEWKHAITGNVISNHEYQRLLNKEQLNYHLHDEDGEIEEIIESKPFTSEDENMDLNDTETSDISDTETPDTLDDDITKKSSKSKSKKKKDDEIID